MLSAAGIERLAGGSFENGRDARFNLDSEISVRAGDIVSLIVNARDSSHACDTTHVGLTLTEVSRKVDSDVGSAVAVDNRTWDLASDTVDHIHDSNPLPDSYGHADVWHYAAVDSEPLTKSALEPDSCLALWRAALVNQQPTEERRDWPKRCSACCPNRRRLAHRGGAGRYVDNYSIGVDHSTGYPSLPNHPRLPRRRRFEGASKEDHAVSDDSRSEAYGIPSQRFGKHPLGSSIDEASLCEQAPHTLEFRLPAALCSSGSEFVVAAELDAATSQDGSVRLQLSTAQPNLQADTASLASLLPILVSRDSKAQAHVEAAMSDFRNLFPAALCYAAHRTRR